MFIIVHTTFPDHATARKAAQTFIAEHLAACVHIGAPIEAHYRWQGRIERGEEIPLSIKTTRERYAALQQRLCELHPYEVPECFAVAVEKALPLYREWVIVETKTAQSSE